MELPFLSELHLLPLLEPVSHTLPLCTFVCACVGRRKTSGVLLYHSLPYSFEAVSLRELEIRPAAGTILLFPTRALGLQVHVQPCLAFYRDVRGSKWFCARRG